MGGDRGPVGARGSVAPGVAVGDAEGRAGDDDICGAVACLPYGFVDDCGEDFGMAIIVDDAAVCLFLFGEELWRLACCWDGGKGQRWGWRLTSSPSMKMKPSLAHRYFPTLDLPAPEGPVMTQMLGVADRAVWG